MSFVKNRLFHKLFQFAACFGLKIRRFPILAMPKNKIY
jgi:hypothetical protein